MKRIGMVLVALGIWTLPTVNRATAQSFLQRLAQPQALPEPLPESLGTTTGASDRPVLGVQVAPVTLASARQFGLPIRQGALITHIELGSPAHRVGLPLGGAIVAMNGKRIDSPKDLVAFMRSATPEQSVELTYYQRNRLFRKTLRLTKGTGPPPGNLATPPAGRLDTLPPPVPPESSLEGQLGGGGQRPFLGRIGRALDQIVPADRQPAAYVPPTGPTPEVTALRKQVQLLQSQVEELRSRLAALESRLAPPPKEKSTSPTGNAVQAPQAAPRRPSD